MPHSQEEQGEEHRHPSPDPFDAALHVESTFHDTGYAQGLADGREAGLAEGRAFGYQKGFEKWFEAGRLASRAVIWANRLPGASSLLNSSSPVAAAESFGDDDVRRKSLPRLPANTRLGKNVSTLYGLVDVRHLSMENSDAAIQDFDDKMKRAEGKVRVIERVVGTASSRT